MWGEDDEAGRLDVPVQEARRDEVRAFGEAHTPRTSGILTGSGGVARFRRRRSAIKGWGKNFPDRHLSDLKRIREEVPDYDEALEQDYTRRELMLLAEKMLLSDPKDEREGPPILNSAMYINRLRNEIYVANGIPDPSIESGLYWRTHPGGRPFSTPELMRTTGCGFYDGCRQTDRPIVEPPPPKQPREVRMCIGPQCDREALGYTDYCAGHRTQFYSGRPLTPIRQADRERLTEIRATWDSGETHAEVSRRYGISVSYAAKLRQEGRAEAIGKFLREGHEKFLDASA